MEGVMEGDMEGDMEGVMAGVMEEGRQEGGYRGGFICAEQVEGVILSYSYSLSFLVGGLDLLHAKKL